MGGKHSKELKQVSEDFSIEHTINNFCLNYNENFVVDAKDKHDTFKSFLGKDIFEWALVLIPNNSKQKNKLGIFLKLCKSKTDFAVKMTIQVLDKNQLVIHSFETANATRDGIRFNRNYIGKYFSYAELVPLAQGHKLALKIQVWDCCFT
jgi:hypothetical protein